MDVYGSPSFQLQQLKDEPLDLESYGGKASSILYGDIRLVNYISNGKTFNATIWLQNSPFTCEDTSKSICLDNVVELQYGMLIDADSNLGTGWDGADYGVNMMWSKYIKGTTKLSEMWDKSVIEYPIKDLSKLMSPIIHNYTGFYENKGKYITISANLAAIGSPTKYKVIYYALVENTAGMKTLDFTSWTDIPPSSFSLFSPDPIVIRNGDPPQTVGLQLKSTSGEVPSRINFTQIENSSSIKVTFNPDKSNISSYMPSPFRIEVRPNTPVGKYEIPLLVNISTIVSKFPDLFGINYYPPTESSTIRNVNLSMTVQEPLTFSEWFKEGWATYGGFIGLIVGGFAAGAASLTFDRIKMRKKGHNTKLF